MTKSYSEIKQEEVGTLNRNRLIEFLYFKCHWREVDIAKKFGFKRQRAHQLVHRKYPETHQNGFWGVLISKAMNYIRRRRC